MIFKRSTTASVKSPQYRDVAEYLHQEILRLVGSTPELNGASYGPTGWRLLDGNWGNSTNGVTPTPLFDEFDSHDITPGVLTTALRCWADKDMDASYELTCYYTLGSEIRFAVEGPNRTIVDGIGATFERMKARLESGPVSAVPAVPVAPEAPIPAAIAAPAPASTQSWLARTWRDHTATAVLGLIVGVALLAIGAWLGFGN